MELDFEPLTILWTVVITGLFLFGLWFIRFGEGGLSLKHRIIVSILSPIIIYFITVWQKNKG